VLDGDDPSLLSPGMDSSVLPVDLSSVSVLKTDSFLVNPPGFSAKRIIYFAFGRVRSIAMSVFVMSVCLFIYLENHPSKLYITLYAHCLLC